MDDSLAELLRLTALPPPGIAEFKAAEAERLGLPPGVDPLPRFVCVGAPTDEDLLAIVIDGASLERITVLLTPTRRAGGRIERAINERADIEHAERRRCAQHGDRDEPHAPPVRARMLYTAPFNPHAPPGCAVLIFPRDAWGALAAFDDVAPAPQGGGAYGIGRVVLDGRAAHAGAPDVEHLLARASVNGSAHSPWGLYAPVDQSLVYVAGPFNAAAPLDMCSQCEEALDRGDHGDCVPPPTLMSVCGVALHPDYRAHLYALEPRFTGEQLATAAAGQLTGVAGQLEWLSARLAEQIRADAP